MSDQNVFVISEDAAVRNHLVQLIAGDEFGTPLVFESSQDFMDRHEPGWCGCILLDLRMTAYAGLRLQRFRLSRGCSIPLVYLLVEQDVPVAIELINGVTFSSFEKPKAGPELLDCVRDALRWHREYCTQTAEQARLHALYASTTLREREVLEGLARGWTNKQIGSELGVSPRTVEIYRGRLQQKLQAKSLAKLIQIFVQLSPATPASTNRPWRNH
jgi:two-component system response regulator FixJ